MVLLRIHFDVLFASLATLYISLFGLTLSKKKLRWLVKSVVIVSSTTLTRILFCIATEC